MVFWEKEGKKQIQWSNFNSEDVVVWFWCVFKKKKVAVMRHFLLFPLIELWRLTCENPAGLSLASISPIQLKYIVFCLFAFGMKLQVCLWLHVSLHAFFSFCSDKTENSIFNSALIFLMSWIVSDFSIIIKILNYFENNQQLWLVLFAGSEDAFQNIKQSD